MFSGFESATIATARTTIFCRRKGAGRPLLGGPLDSWYTDAGGPLAIWRTWAPRATGRVISGGHFFPEANPAETIAEMRDFFSPGRLST
jgi:hypothetical protein